MIDISSIYIIKIKDVHDFENDSSISIWLIVFDKDSSMNFPKSWFNVSWIIEFRKS